MDFAAAWSALDIGDSVDVSNGTPRPAANPASLPMRIWQSHNFTGDLVEMIDAPTRSMRFNLPANADGNVIGFTVRESDGHTFTLA